MSEAGREWAWAGGWAALILVATTIPVPDTADPGAFPLDKLAHGVLYAGLGGLSARALRRTGQWGRTGLACVLLGGLVFAALDELHQHWIATRAPSLGDWIADAVGLVAGVATVAVAAARAGDRGNGTSREAYPSPHGGDEPPGGETGRSPGKDGPAGGPGGAG